MAIAQSLGRAGLFVMELLAELLDHDYPNGAKQYITSYEQYQDHIPVSRLVEQGVLLGWLEFELLKQLYYKIFFIFVQHHGLDDIGYGC